jgi:hypothetical protein
MIAAIHTALSAAAATSTMTLFSYIVSDKEGENFREPDLLGGFLEKSFGIKEKISQPLGWVSHYLIGAGFAAGYKFLLNTAETQPSPKNGILYGAFAGLAGILSWKVSFENHPNPPKTHRKGFYAQLMVAHLIFGLTLSAFKNKRDS